jgi:hypothetical protein
MEMREAAVAQRGGERAGAVHGDVGFDPQRFDLAGRKAQRQAVLKAQHIEQHLLLRHAVPAQPLHEQAHGLHELVALGLVQQVLDHARFNSPLRGRHRISSSPELCDTITNSVKQFR